MDLMETFDLECNDLQPTFVTTQEIAMNMLQGNEVDGNDSCGRDILCLSSFKDSNTTSDRTRSVRKAVNCLSTSTKSMSSLEPLCSQIDEESNEGLKGIKNTEAKGNGKRVRRRMKGVCHICGLVLQRHNYLENHIASFHDTTKEFRCSECDHTTNSRRYLMRHYRLTHGYNNVFSCADCDFKSPTLLHLRNHTQDVHKPNSHACNACDFKTSRKHQLLAHVREQHKPRHINNKCAQCPFTTRWRSHLYLHVKQKHTDKVASVVHTCRQCPFTTRWRSHLYKHVKDKHPPEEAEREEVRRFVCQECDFSTKYQSHLYKHRKIKHPGVVFERERPGRRKKEQKATQSKVVSRETKTGDDVVGDADVPYDETSMGRSTFASVWESFATSFMEEDVDKEESGDGSFAKQMVDNEARGEYPVEASKRYSRRLHETRTNKASKHQDEASECLEEESKRAYEASKCFVLLNRHLPNSSKYPDKSKSVYEASKHLDEPHKSLNEVSLHEVSMGLIEVSSGLHEVNKSCVEVSHGLDDVSKRVKRRTVTWKDELVEEIVIKNKSPKAMRCSQRLRNINETDTKHTGVSPKEREVH